MRSFILPAALAVLAVASPVPQEIDLDMVDAAPDPTFTQVVGAVSQAVTYDTATIVAAATSVTSVTVESVAAASSPAADDELARLVRRGDCSPQPAGATGAPKSKPDKPSAFASNEAFAAAASSAPVPSGYDQTFVNLNASNSAYGYMGFTSLDNYDTKSCAAKCDAIAGCQAINIYFERDPTVDPGVNCPDPKSVTMIKCVFWGGPVTPGNANNDGQYRQDFHVLIAGSNGYVSKRIATPAGYTGPMSLGNAAINAPYDSEGYNTYMGSKVFTSGPFNVQLCADYCSAQSAYNLRHPPTDGSPVQTCQFFNTYILYKNTQDNVQGQYCTIYSEAWGASYATNTGQYRGSDHYMIYNSYAFTNYTGIVSPNKNGAVHQASKDITYSSLQTYCSTVLGQTASVDTVTTTTTVTPSTTSTVIITPTVTNGPTTTTVTITSTSASLSDLQGPRKRQDSSDQGVTLSLVPSTPASGKLMLVTVTITPAESTETAATRAKRDMSTPNVLTKYPATVVSSACALVVTSKTTADSTTTVQATTSASSTTIYTTTTGATVTVAGSTVTTATTTTVDQATCSATTKLSGGSTSDQCGCQYLETCGKVAQKVDNVGYYNLNANSLADCVAKCDYYMNCAGLQYDTSTTACIVYTQDDSRMFTGDGTTVDFTAMRQNGCDDSQCNI